MNRREVCQLIYKEQQIVLKLEDLCKVALDDDLLHELNRHYDTLFFLNDYLSEDLVYIDAAL